MLRAVYLAVKRLLILVLLAAPVWSATLERLSLDDMTVKSTAIVRGKVTATWAKYTGAVIYTHYTVQVSETFKGASKGTVEIMVPGGAVNGRQQNFSGSPLLKTGDEFVFFLWTSNSGITWITGLTQGLFTLPAAGTTAGATTDRMATRQASRELMLDPTTSQAVKDTALSMPLSQLRSRIAATLAGGGK